MTSDATSLQLLKRRKVE